MSAITHLRDIPLPPPTDFSDDGRAALEAFYRNRGALTDEAKSTALTTHAIKEPLMSEHTLRQLEYFVLMEWGFEE